ncbi:AEC family transporter [Acuticoccus sp. MNP-M23]|uniref:AEC family transporter n=1 Tax=Acuticoccus sp. MNP-M23 TaxID=3072793 RepID=UPI002814FEAE|nr:AEC family transporter [Acuticoccus sp. MNP-M23]WMS42176.1 AEC family transporter [Acuticoccus sp. MNP-M23]
MRDVLTLTVPFFGLIFLGFVVGRIARRPAAGLEWLNIFILYVALPALFFQLLAATPFEELSNVSFILAVLGATSTVLVAGFALALWMSRGNVERATIQSLIGAYSNNGYLGPGLALSAVGASATVPVALIFAFENTMFFTLTPILMAVGGAAVGTPAQTARMILKRIFTHPFILAVIFGATAAAFSWQPPEMLNRMLTMLRDAAAPCALFAMGVTVALQPLPTRGAMSELSIFLTFKLVAHPVMAFLFVSMVDADPIWLTTAVLMAALPPATNVFVLATQYRTYVEGASNAVLVGTAASAITVTAVLYAIRQGLL